MRLLKLKVTGNAATAFGYIATCARSGRTLAADHPFGFYATAQSAATDEMDRKFGADGWRWVPDTRYSVESMDPPMMTVGYHQRMSDAIRAARRSSREVVVWDAWQDRRVWARWGEE